MSAGTITDNVQKDYRPLVLLFWALLIAFLRLIGFFPYSHKEKLQTPAENHYFAWIQSATVLDDGLYRFRSAVEMEQFCQQNDFCSLSLTNQPAFDVMAFSSAKHEIKETTKLSPMVAPFFFLPVSVNDASADVLGTLPGIGKKLAERIIEYRQDFGLFQRIDDLLVVKGIGEKKLNRLRTLICL